VARRKAAEAAPPPEVRIVPEIRFVYRVEFPNGSRRFLRYGCAENAVTRMGMIPKPEATAENKLRRRSGRRWPWTQAELPF